MITAGVIFLLTLFFIIIQPKNLSIGTIALIGALAAFIFGVVTLTDILEVTQIVWDATLAFVGIIIFSIVLDEIGFFQWCAIKIAMISGGNGIKMFIFSLILGALVAAFFANDAAALILTPILLSKMRLLRLNSKTIIAFLLAGGFISDSASLPFVFSNLTNIVTADYFSFGFMEYFIKMFFPFCVSVILSIVILLIFFYKEIPQRVDISLLGDAKKTVKNKFLFYFSWFFLFILLCGYIIGDIFHIPVSFFAFGGGVFFLFLASFFDNISIKYVLKKAPWHIVWFSIGLYVVIYGLKNVGLTQEIAKIIVYSQSYGNFAMVMVTGYLSAFLSAIMNNLPSIMIMDIAIKNLHHPLLAYANIIGANIGPKMTPFGSLATLLWLDILAKNGVKISFLEYTKFGIIITPIVLSGVLLSLFIGN